MGIWLVRAAVSAADRFPVVAADCGLLSQHCQCNSQENHGELSAPAQRKDTGMIIHIEIVVRRKYLSQSGDHEDALIRGSSDSCYFVISSLF